MALRLAYWEAAPEAYEKLIALGHYINTATALEPVLLGLVYLRASQMNGCGFCMGMHAAELRKHHEPESRIDAVAEWRTSDAFTGRERAALAWTESVTDLQGSRASDEDFAAVSEFFHDKDLVDLTFAIANINAWNRLGVAFRTEWKPPAEKAEAK
jgi:AhpD family alkylhydroperoxidase